MATYLVHLHTLEISDCWSLKEIVNVPLMMGSLLKLKDIKVEECNQLRNLLQLSTAVDTLDLEELWINVCGRMKEVISWEGRPEEDAATSKLLFPKLLELKIYYAPSLICFCKGAMEIEFHQLTSLNLWNLPVVECLHLINSPPVKCLVSTSNENPLKSFFPPKVFFPSLVEMSLYKLKNMKEIWRGQLQSRSFVNLSDLNIKNCDSLEYVLSPYTASYLVNLCRLDISYCNNLKEVVSAEKEVDGIEEYTSSILPKLKVVKLYQLPALDRFYHVANEIEFPELDNVEVVDCPVFKSFSPVFVHTPILSHVKLYREYFLKIGEEKVTMWEGDLNSTIQHLHKINEEARNMWDVKPRIMEEANDKSKIWKLTEISDPSQCRSIKLTENTRVPKISRLIYTNSGRAILALASNAVHLLWVWQRNEHNSSGKATASVPPQLWQPPSGIVMTNDIADSNPEDVVPCFALSKNNSYVVSASGGKISLFNVMTFKTETTFMPPPPAATFLAFNPQDNNIIAIGKDDSSIQIYNVYFDKVKSNLKGHSKRVTGLAFSHVLNVLVSSGADAQLFVWSSENWKKQKSRFLQIPPGRSPSAQSDTRVQFHQDQTHFLVVHESQLAIFHATNLECVKHWAPRESTAPISHATFSCDSQLVYASFLDATVCVFTASDLQLRCRINPSTYLSPSNSNVHPLVIAAHPQETNQFALGLSDGAVHVFEPLESEDKWVVPSPVEDASASTVSAAPSIGTSGSGPSSKQWASAEKNHEERNEN